MPKPVSIAPKGDIDYTYEIVPTHFSEDRWVQMAELRPSTREHVHHAVVYIRPPDSKWLRSAPVGVPFTTENLTDEQGRRDAHWTDSDILLVYAPGSSPETWASGMAKFIPAGSDLVIQMHYMAMGHAASDRTSIGLVFAKQPSTTARVDPAADQRPLCHSSPRIPTIASRLAEHCPTTQRFSASFRTCIGGENASNTT